MPVDAVKVGAVNEGVVTQDPLAQGMAEDVVPAPGPLAGPVSGTWLESDRFLPARVVRPLQRFAQVEAAGGIVMVATAGVALGWANSAWHGSYDALWSAPVTVTAGPLRLLDTTARGLVNDVAMTLFFFVVTASIKRELLAGHLTDRRRAALPVLAALGGMAAPALLYFWVTGGDRATQGWGIPTATDIAFAVGVLSLLGSRVPAGTKVFLLTLAVVDDLGGIVLIAVVYSGRISLPWLLAALVPLALTVVLRRWHVRAVPVYAVVATLCWLALSRSGVEPTMAGVAFALLTPMRSHLDPALVPSRAGPLLESVTAGGPDSADRAAQALRDVSRLARESSSPLERVLDRVTPWVSYAVVPAFALANAGLRVRGMHLDAVGSRVAAGVVVAFVVGKPLGILLTCWAACRLRVGALPRDSTWTTLTGAAVCAGIGFTVSLYITRLSLASITDQDAARLGVLVASVAAAVAGLLFLAVTTRRRRPLSPTSTRIGN
ncbi:MAG: Na+/H+ antiporter NhaA [Blastococcus sp.]